MTRKDDLAARAQRLAGRRPAVEPGVPAEHPAVPAAAVVPRWKPVRVTVDVQPQTHRFLTGFGAETAVLSGRTRVAHTDILRALLAELEVSPQLQAAVRERLRSVSQ